MRPLFYTLRGMDWLLTFAVVALVLFGLAAIYSVALSHPDSDFLDVKKQLIAAAIGGTLFVLVTLSNYRLLRNYSIALYVVGILLLIGVLLFGTTIRGTTGWYAVAGFSFQPVEFMKVALAVALASYFSQRARKTAGLRELVESGVIAGIPAGLVMLQPDLGSALLLLGMWGITLLFAGLKRRYVILLALLVTVTAVGSWQFLQPYQKDRILTFLDPSRDPQGQGYHVIQATIAVGAGGWLGSGLGFGTQSQLKFLPESQTDFIFAVIAEELGFLGVCLVLGAFVLLFARLQYHASSTRDDFTSFLLIAISAVLFVQMFVNVGMNIGMLPVTGITLPLVSYGGSSLIFTLLMLGIAQSIAVHSEHRSHPATSMLQ